MVQDISGEGFDAYYVKIKQQALSYLDKVTVKFSDGQQMVIDGNTIRAQYYDSLNRSNNGGVATSVQLDNQGNYFFRLNLMKVVDGSGNPVDLAANPKAAYAKHVPSFGKEDAYAYRDTFNDYADGVPTFRVTQIVYDVTINQAPWIRPATRRCPTTASGSPTARRKLGRVVEEHVLRGDGPLHPHRSGHVRHGGQHGDLHHHDEHDHRRRVLR